jgi:nuclear pore complex protein Nup98-Nup96
LFGNTNTSNTNTGGGLFGSTQNNQNNSAGQTGQANTGGLFGGGGFGMQNKPAGTTTGTSLFGSTNTTAQQPGTSLFGNTGAAGGFGATGAAGGGTSLFGNNQANQQQQPGAQPAGQTGGLFSGGSLFGNNNANKPAGTSLFGSTGPTQQSNTGGGLFGNLGQSQNQQQQQQAPGFGTGSLFGNQSTNNNNNSLVNSQAQQQMPQINPNDPYGSGNLFANPPNFAPINTSTTKTLPPLTSSFKAMPTPVKQPLRLRGYAASPGVNSPRLGGSVLGNSALGLSTASSGSPMRGSLFDRPSTDVLSPAAFTPRSSFKKLVINKKITGANLAASLSKSPRSAVDRNLINPDADGDVGNGNVSLFGGNESVSGTPSRSVSAAAKANTNGKSAPAPKSLNTLSRNVDLDDFEQGEYYTIPDMHSLCNAAHEELKTVEDFVVGRKGFGELRYLEPVDVASIGDLKSICGQYVVFQRGTCEVYPEGTVPMEPGNGLNHHARITLEKCFPKDKSTGEPVTDPTAPRVQQHMRKLKAMDGTSFQSYDPQTGTWVFEVDHFTKYGLEDDDDDDMDDVEPSDHSRSPSSRASPSSLPERSVTTRSPSTAPGSVTASLSSHNDENDSQSEGFQYDDAKLKLSVFEQDFTPTASKFVDQQSHLSYFHEAEEDDVREFDMTHVKPTSFGYQLPSSFQPTWSYQSIPGTSSLATKHEHSQLDLGASQCRSFGVGWSRQGSLVSYGKVAALDSSNQFQPFVINQKSRPGIKVASERERRRMQEMMDVLIERSDIQVDQGVPFIRTQDSLRFQHLTGLFAGDKSHEAQAWRLGAALFDPIVTRHSAESDNLMIDMDAFSRKMAFSDWLESSVAPAVERADLNAAEGPEKVFALLSGHRLEEAVNHALHSGDLRLATLLGSIGNEETKTAMAAQLDAWRKDKVDTHISKEYLRVYALLAGKTDVMSEHGPGGVNVTEGLDWLRAFGLSFWYYTPLEQPIEFAVEAFQQRLEQVSSLPQPVLKHVSSYRAQQESRPEDALYSLVKIYCRQDRALDVLSDPAKFGKTAGEARVQWHVCDLLLNVLGYGSDDVARDWEAFDQLTVAYAAQLESANLWTSAVFILLHLSEEHA